jgi:hypothetical protein
MVILPYESVWMPRLATIGTGVKLHCAKHAWGGCERRHRAICADVLQAARGGALA